MSPVDIILAASVVLLTFGGMLHFFVVRTRLEQAANGRDFIWDAIKDLRAQPNTNDLSAEFVELHRKLTELQTITSNQEMRLTDIHDTVEHRYNRLRMRQARAQQEGEEPEPEVDPETAHQLLMDLNGAQAPEEQQQQHRARLVPKHRRDKYGRR